MPSAFLIADGPGFARPYGSPVRSAADGPQGTGAAVSPLLEARGLSYAPNANPVLRPVDIAIAPHRITIILGPNGAGKSVLLRLLHGLLEPTAGKILWRGASVTEAARREQAMVFQTPVLLRRGVAANVDLALSGVPRAQRRERREAVLSAVRLSHCADRPARLLSGGEKQRLALARALVSRPSLLFLDEPTASLDPASTALIEELLSRENERGLTVVLVTHDLNQARRLADDAIFMDAGRIAEAGPAPSLFTAPRSEAMRAYCEGRLHVSRPQT